MSKKVAILVDGDFFIRRYKSHLKKRSVDKYEDLNPERLARAIHTHCLKHINKENDEELYRIFFYDCKPLDKKVHYPHTQRALDLSKSSTYKERTALHKHLISKPCLALRLGYLDTNNARWVIRDQEKEKKLFNRKISIEEFQNDDFIYHAKQKGVDIKIGLDIATLALKKLVQKIVLISGDSDFVPAAKLARVEGIIFTLDPMGKPIREDLEEHIDYLTTRLPQFKKQQQ
ncbi:NYN domain-containing protein [Helicobacter pylori]|uniref:NYN domain-containing protein n=1 Tax=Helicobacter pylori TaxID=210 RepID=UPI000762C1A5|nr:NYN domain-containing protein [Helicobacter pylori]OJZ97304.1 helicase [Helicobacter pylori]OJZ99265.1 helicase [Helicobacter pylori]